MLKNLLHPLSIICIKFNLLLLKTQVKEMESAGYLNLQSRIDLAKIKEKCMQLTQKANATHTNFLNVG